jgi:hypothetical protein
MGLGLKSIWPSHPEIGFKVHVAGFPKYLSSKYVVSCGSPQIRQLAKAYLRRYLPQCLVTQTGSLTNDIRNVLTNHMPQLFVIYLKRP